MNETENTYIDLSTVNNEHMPSTFTVMRDGELDMPYYKALQRAERIESIKHALGTITAAVGTSIQATVKHISAPIYLELVDAAEGSHLRDQYFAQRRAERIRDAAGRYSLSV